MKMNKSLIDLEATLNGLDLQVKSFHQNLEKVKADFVERSKEFKQDV